MLLRKRQDIHNFVDNENLEQREKKKSNSICNYTNEELFNLYVRFRNSDENIKILADFMGTDLEMASKKMLLFELLINTEKYLRAKELTLNK